MIFSYHYLARRVLPSFLNKHTISGGALKMRTHMDCYRDSGVLITRSGKGGINSIPQWQIILLPTYEPFPVGCSYWQDILMYVQYQSVSYPR